VHRITANKTLSNTKPYQYCDIQYQPRRDQEKWTSHGLFFPSPVRQRCNPAIRGRFTHTYH